jgi:hypothetical protein
VIAIFLGDNGNDQSVFGVKAFFFIKILMRILTMVDCQVLDAVVMVMYATIAITNYIKIVARTT